jgi:hypothetical protein
VLAFLRFVGVTNAAVWFGSLIFFTICAGPAFFTPDMYRLVGKPLAGAVAQILLERYFILQNWCCVIALAHLIVEWLYTHKPMRKLLLYLLAGLLGLGLFADFVLLPKMKHLHLVMYGVQSTPAQREAAKKDFGMLHGISQSANLLVIGGVLFYLATVTASIPFTRFAPANKFRT